MKYKIFTRWKMRGVGTVYYVKLQLAVLKQVILLCKPTEISWQL